MRLLRRDEHLRFRELLSPYIDRRLKPREVSALERHLAACQSCSRELASLKATLELLQGVPVLPPPRPFTLAPMAPQPFMPAFRLLAGAATVTALLLAALLVSEVSGIFYRGASTPIGGYAESKAVSGLGLEGGPQAREGAAPAPAAPAPTPAPQPKADLEHGAQETPRGVQGLFWLRPLEVFLGALIVMLVGAMILLRWRTTRGAPRRRSPQ